MSDPVPLGRVLAALRVGRGWSQAELARRSGLAPAQVSRYERGAARPSFDSLERLLGGLGVDRFQLARVSRVLKEAESGTEAGPGSRGLPPERPPLPPDFTDLFLGRGGEGEKAGEPLGSGSAARSGRDLAEGPPGPRAGPGPGPGPGRAQAEEEVVAALRALAALTRTARPAADDPEGERLARRAGDLVEQLVRHHFRRLAHRRS